MGRDTTADMGPGEDTGRDTGADTTPPTDMSPDTAPPADMTGDAAPPADMTGDAPPSDGACLPCSSVLPPTNGSPDNVCPGKSTDLVNALRACTCEGACMADCADNRCTGGDPSGQCVACVVGTGCMAEYQACAADM